MVEAHLYTRSEHGSMPVVVHDEGARFDVGPPLEDGGRTYDSARQLMTALYGGDRHVPWRRYFQVGRYAPVIVEPLESVLELWGDLDTTPVPSLAAFETWGRWSRPSPSSSMRAAVPLESVLELWGRDGDLTVDAGGPGRLETDTRLTVDPGARTGVVGARGASPRVIRARSRRISVRSPSLGIDLETRSDEVRKLFYAGFGRRCFNAGYDTEDVLQEVYQGLLSRNLGTCPYDPAKSSFGHYVHMVAGCILSNYRRKEQRRRAREQVGVRAFIDGHLSDVDASVALRQQSESRMDSGFHDLEMRQATAALTVHLERVRGVSRVDVGYALVVLPFKAAGCTRKEIRAHTGMRPAHVDKGVRLLQLAARSWPWS